jgi:6-pyruvoyltetrahydropterin/6-carboxytetrahydropterin synthase
MSETFELQVDFQFEAAHRLPNVPDGHKCRRLHGHSFCATVTVQGPLHAELGWVMDYSDIRNTVEPVRRQLDHYYLNEVEGLGNPTSEAIAGWIWDRLAHDLVGLVSVSVAETCTARCTYRGEGTA